MRPPRCDCGYYASAECVVCDMPLCQGHVRLWSERVHCVEHHDVEQERLERRLSEQRSLEALRRAREEAAAAERDKRRQMEEEALAEVRLAAFQAEAELQRKQAEQLARDRTEARAVAVGATTTKWTHWTFSQGEGRVVTFCGIEDRVVRGHLAVERCAICQAKYEDPVLLAAARRATEK